MDTNLFNPELFLNSTVNESNATELLPVPEGEYTAMSGPVSAESFRDFDIKKGQNAGKKGYSLDIEWTINDDGGVLKELLGREPKVRQGIMLDLGPGGVIDCGKGKNVALGRTREALGQNQAGRPWSFSMLGGQVAKIKVKHRLDANSGRTYVEVSDVTKAA